MWRFTPQAGTDANGNPVTDMKVYKGFFDDTTAPSWTYEGDQLFPDVVGDATAAWFIASPGNVVLLYPDSSGELLYELVDTADIVPTVLFPIPYWPSGVTASNASATVSGGKLVVVFRDTSAAYDAPGNVYVTTMDSSGTWTAPVPIQGVSSLVTPGIAEAADGKLYLAFANSAAVSETFPIDLFRKDSGTLGDGTGWVDAGLGSIPSGPTGDTLTKAANDHGARINLLSVPYLYQYIDPSTQQLSLQPFSDGSGYLALFWNVGDPTTSDDHATSWHLLRAYTAGYFTPSPGGDTATAPPKEGWHMQVQFDRAYPGHSTAVAEGDGNVMAFYTGTSYTPPSPNSTWFAPYVLGIPPEGIPSNDLGRDDDWDDETTIANNMCYSSWLLAGGAYIYCLGDGNSYSTVTPMTQPCDPSSAQ